MNSKKLGEVGEFKIIEKIRERFLKGSGVEVGIGDDTAVLKVSNSKLLVTVDMLVEGVHFFPSISPADLGWKSLAVSLSDISAMGGKPLFSLLSLSLPSHLPEQWLDDFLAGWRELAELFGVSLVGGDLTKGERIIVDSIVLGEAEKPVLRSGARVGDRIYLTGSIGDSSAGLRCIEKGLNYPNLIRKHLRPMPRVKEGIRIGESGRVHSMIDISDGLVGDLAHICEESRVGAVIYSDKLPLSADLLTFCREQALSAKEFALFGGEDYELLLTAEANLTEFFEFPLYEIGEIREGGGIFLLDNGEEKPIERRGFDHFR